MGQTSFFHVRKIKLTPNFFGGLSLFFVNIFIFWTLSSCLAVATVPMNIQHFTFKWHQSFSRLQQSIFALLLNVRQASKCCCSSFNWFQWRWPHHSNSCWPSVFTRFYCLFSKLTRSFAFMFVISFTLLGSLRFFKKPFLKISDSYFFKYYYYYYSILLAVLSLVSFILNTI